MHNQAITLAQLQQELNKDEAALFSEDSYVGEVTLPGLLRLGMEHEDQLDAIKDDLAEDHRLSTSLKAAEMQTRINSYAARIKRWKILQTVLMPMVSVHIPSDPQVDDIHLSSVVSRVDRSPLEIKMYMPSEVPLPLREKVCTEEMIEAEAKLRYATGLAAIVDLRYALRQRYSVGQWKNGQTGHGVPTTRARGTIKASSKKCRRMAYKYRRCREALLNLDQPNAPISRFSSIPDNWRSTFQELRASDVRFMNVLVRDMEGRMVLARRKKERIAQMHSVTGRSGQKHRTLSWIWRMGKESADAHVRDLNGDGTLREDTHLADTYDVDQLTVQAEWAKARARSDRWREELTLVQFEMRRVVSYLEWKAEEWERQKSMRQLKNIKSLFDRVTYRQGLAAYASRQAQVYRNMAAHCVNTWRNHLRYYQLDNKWASHYPSDPKEEREFGKLVKAQERRKANKEKRQKEEDDMEDDDDDPDNLWEDKEDVPIEGSKDKR